MWLCPMLPYNASLLESTSTQTPAKAGGRALWNLQLSPVERLPSSKWLAKSTAAPVLEQSLDQIIQPGCKLLLDMREVTFLSSAALRILLLLYREVEKVGGRVVLLGLSDVIRDTLDVTGFLDFFTVADTSETALRFLEG